MANKQFGEVLRNLRNAKGYTQQQVADILGLKNKSTLGSWEVGKSEPDGYTFLKLCKIYDIENIYDTFEGSPTVSINEGMEHFNEQEQVTHVENKFNQSNTLKGNFTSKEQELIKKYRALDERGKLNVDRTLDNEYEYLISKEKEKSNLLSS